MTRTRKLLPASWKGIPFLVRSEVLTEGGRRIVLHEYPNSNERFVEDLGELPPKFSVTAFVTGPDFLDRADQLERALREPGRGRLSMPTFGVLSLFALPYRKDASQTDVGEIRFGLSFVAGRAVSGPSKAPDTVQTVYSNGDIARERLAEALEDIWDVPTTTSNVLTGQFDLTQSIESLNTLRTVLNNVTELDSIVDIIKVNSQSMVRDTATLANTFIRRTWQTVSEGLTGGAGLSALIDLTRYGSQLSLSLADIRSAVVGESSNLTAEQEATQIPLWDPVTAERVKRDRNRLTLINSHRVAALISGYEQAADRSYQTDGEIEETRLSLDNEYQRLMRSDTEDRGLPQSRAAVRFAVDDVRLSALSILDDKEQAAYSLAGILENTQVSAFVLSYDLYAEEFTALEQVTERAVDIRSLNINEPSDRMAGDLTVLQS